MKTIILIAIVFGSYFIVAFSCNGYKESKPKQSTAEDWAKASNDYPSDTVIHQEVGYSKNKYWLQTWVQTRKQQTHLSEFRSQIFIEGDSYAEYNVSIAGAFEYIKSMEPFEYNKALIFVDKLKTLAITVRLKNKQDSIRKKQIYDSLILLNNAQIKS